LLKQVQVTAKNTFYFECFINGATDDEDNKSKIAFVHVSASMKPPIATERPFLAPPTQYFKWLYVPLRKSFYVYATVAKFQPLGWEPGNQRPVKSAPLSLPLWPKGSHRIIERSDLPQVPPH
jgi:hypothetical protein